MNKFNQLLIASLLMTAGLSAHAAEHYVCVADDGKTVVNVDGGPVYTALITVKDVQFNPSFEYRGLKKTVVNDPDNAATITTIGAEGFSLVVVSSNADGTSTSTLSADDIAISGMPVACKRH